MTLERISVGDGIALGAALLETALLTAMAGKARPLVHNGAYRSYVLPPVTLSGRTFPQAMLYGERKAEFAAIMCRDRHGPSAEEWKMNSVKELARCSLLG